MEMLTGFALLILLPLVIWARQRVDAAAGRRRDEGSGGVDMVIDPSACADGGADGGCGGGCGGCGS